MQVDLSSNYFALFGFAVDFDLDTQLLGSRWQELQRSLHPDRFVSATDAERRYSMQAASLVNEAHKVLTTPLARASYLLKLRDIDLDVETDTRMSPEFLMEQMELREQLDEVETAADPYVKVDSIRSELKDMATQTEGQFKKHYSADDMVSARDAVRQWQFIDKLQREVSDLEADLDDA